MVKYDLVYRHDRAGRLVDARAFEYWFLGLRMCFVGTTTICLK